MQWDGLAAILALTLASGCGGSVRGDAQATRPGAAGAGATLDGGTGPRSFSQGGAGGLVGMSATDGGGATGVSGSEAGIDNPACQVVMPVEQHGRGGYCTPPPLPLPSGDPCACLPLPGAPGAEGCAPSGAASYGTACCTESSCGFDYGQGCTLEPFSLPNVPALTEQPACAALSNGPPELLRTGSFDRATANASAVYLLEQGSESVVTRFSKADCSTREVYRSTSAVTTFAATDTALYVLATSSTGAQELDSYPDDGTPGGPVPLDTMLGNPECFVAALGSDAGSAYIIVECPVIDGGRTIGSQAIELPCCNGAAESLAPLMLPLPLPRAIDVFRDGDNVVWKACADVPNLGTRCSVATADGATGRALLVVDESTQALSPFLAMGGRIYFGQGLRVMEVAPTDCGARVAIDQRPGTITALAARDGDFYWAEHGRGVTFSDVIMIPMSGSHAGLEIGVTEGDVRWLSVDATHVYWLAQGSTTNRLVRAPRPAFLDGG